MRKIKYNAPVTLTFALICLTVLGFDFITKGYSTEMFFMTYRASWLNPLTYLRMITYCVGHIGFAHFFGNISYILLLGPLLEEKYGSKRMLEMILITAFIGGLLNNLLFSRTALCGASGIVFMMIVLSSVTSVKDNSIPLTLILILVIYLGQEVYNAIFITDSVSQFTHIAGGICGALLGMNNKK